MDYRHGYYAGSSVRDGGMGFDTIVHQDFGKDRRTIHQLTDGDRTGEPIFVPKSAGAVEGEGYLLSIIYRAKENRSDLAFFDAQDIQNGPFATAELPHRVPHGFHGNWKYND